MTVVEYLQVPSSVNLHYSLFGLFDLFDLQYVQITLLKSRKVVYPIKNII